MSPDDTIDLTPMGELVLDPAAAARALAQAKEALNASAFAVQDAEEALALALLPRARTVTPAEGEGLRQAIRAACPEAPRNVLDDLFRTVAMERSR